MTRPSNIRFLTDKENKCFELLLQAQDLFDEICKTDPQSPTDSYNFGHYLDAARNAVITRGARRMDPENLLKKHTSEEGTQTTMCDEIFKMMQRPIDKEHPVTSK